MQTTGQTVHKTLPFMKYKTLFLPIFIAFSSGFAQDRLYDKVIVDLANPVHMGGERLTPGRYELRQVADTAGGARVMLASEDGTKRFEAAVTTIPALANNTPNAT